MSFFLNPRIFPPRVPREHQRADWSNRSVRSLVSRSLTVTVLTTLALAPLVMLIATSLARGWFFPAVLPGAIDGSAWMALFTDESLRSALGNSLLLGVATAVVATAFALPLGRSAAMSTTGVRRTVALLAFAAVALPPVALGIGLQLSVLAIGLGGSLGGVFLAHLVPAVGYLTLVFLGVFTRWDRRLDETAAMLGATSRDRWRLVTLPLLRRPIVEALALGFLVSWAQVALTLLVGGGAVRTLPLDVLAMLQAGQDQRAAAGALALALPALIVIGASRVAARNTAAVVA